MQSTRCNKRISNTHVMNPTPKNLHAPPHPKKSVLSWLVVNGTLPTKSLPSHFIHVLVSCFCHNFLHLQNVAVHVSHIMLAHALLYSHLIFPLPIRCSLHVIIHSNVHKGTQSIAPHIPGPSLSCILHAQSRSPLEGVALSMDIAGSLVGLQTTTPPSPTTPTYHHTHDHCAPPQEPTTVPHHTNPPPCPTTHPPPCPTTCPPHQPPRQTTTLPHHINHHLAPPHQPTLPHNQMPAQQFHSISYIPSTKAH